MTIDVDAKSTFYLFESLFRVLSWELAVMSQFSNFVERVQYGMKGCSLLLQKKSMGGLFRIHAIVLSLYFR